MNIIETIVNFFVNFTFTFANTLTLIVGIIAAVIVLRILFFIGKKIFACGCVIFLLGVIFIALKGFGII